MDFVKKKIFFIQALLPINIAKKKVSIAGLGVVGCHASGWKLVDCERTQHFVILLAGMQIYA